MSFYSLCIVEWYLNTEEGKARYLYLAGYERLKGHVLQRAVLHDIEESRTGDIHRPFKVSSSELHDSLSEAGKVAAHQVLTPLFDKNHQHFFEMWKNAKDDTLAGRIVAFADLLGVVCFVIQEGPRAIESLNLETLKAHADHFKDKQYDFIRPLVNDLEQLLEEVL